MTESFNLAALAALPTDHDTNPNEIPIGFQGCISEETRRKVYSMRREAQREAATPKCIKSLEHLRDHIVGLAADIACEMEGAG
jgi:hypothetical protein